MARSKPQVLYPVKDLKEANAALAELGAAKRRLAAIEARMNDEISRIKARAEAEAAPLHTNIKNMEAGLTAFALHNKDELFATKRTISLDFGSIGFRRSTEIKAQAKKTLADVLERLKALGHTDAISVTEKVNKDELRKWSAERLETVCARRVEKDTFGYELDEEKLAEDAA